MANYGVVQTQAWQPAGVGTAITAATATEMIPTPARFQWSPAPPIKVGDRFTFKASGIISCAVTTPGTARYDIRAGSVVIADSGAMSLNVVAKTNVPWDLEVKFKVESIGNGTTATVRSWFRWTSEAVVGSATGTALAICVSPGVGAGFDSTITNTVTSFFTQTVATGSMTEQDCAWYWDN